MSKKLLVGVSPALFAALALMPTYVLAASPPTVETKAASLITKNGATLNGTVNPNGLEVTECKFEYGPTTSYGTSVACIQEPGSGTSPREESNSAFPLAPNTTYHYRIVATNAAGTSHGSDVTFKTLPEPPSVETKAASAVTDTSATLNGSVNPNGAEVSDCHFEYGTTTAYGSSATCTPSPGSGTSPIAVSAPVTGLTANTTYHFRISATNAGGTSKGSDAMFTTPFSRPTVETQAASAVTVTSATLNGSVNPNGAEANNCHFEYGTTTSYGSFATCSPLPGSGKEPVAVSASVTGLSANTTYHYRIVATNVGGASQGSDVTFTTLPKILHYYVNGSKLKEGESNKRVIIAWGNITLTGTEGPVNGGHITCHTVWAGTVLNPAGGGAGEGLTQVFASFQCEQTLFCPSKTTAELVQAEALPWHNLLTEESPGTIRQETTGIKLDVQCYEGGLLIAELKFVTAPAPEKGPRPEFSGGTETVHPGFLSFDAESGILVGETCGCKLKPEGAIKLLGYNAQELIAAKSP